MTETALIDAPQSVQAAATQFVEVVRRRVNLYQTSETSDFQCNLLKAILTRTDSTDKTSQQASSGRKLHPFDFDATSRLQLLNPHHSTCIKTKVAATVGLGFTDSLEVEPGDPLSGKPSRRIQKKSKVEETLDALCDCFFMDVLSDACEDFFQVGNGYMEVKRGRDNRITGLFHIPAATIQVEVEENGYDYHFIVMPSDNSSSERKFARFGDRERLIEVLSLSEEEAEFVSEVIHFRQPTSLSRWYGFPDWLSAVPCIELVQCMIQYQYDFFLNRGVPEFMLFILGQKLPADDWTRIENALKTNIGMGNSHKSLALNLSNNDIRIQLEKLGIEEQPEGGFEATETGKALSIVTAHRVPPLLAGIQIPGKLGATNEMINAMMSFHTLVIAPAQAVFQKTLGSTLGLKETGLGLTHDDFTFRTLLDDLDPSRMDTIGRMRQELPAANAQGRNVDDGLKS